MLRKELRCPNILGKYSINGGYFRTACVTVVLSLYLGRKKTPIPVWTRKKGCRIIWYPFHQVFAVRPFICIVGKCLGGRVVIAPNFGSRRPGFESR